MKKSTAWRITAKRVFKAKARQAKPSGSKAAHWAWAGVDSDENRNDHAA